jgi:hypothetical protein
MISTCNKANKNKIISVSENKRTFRILNNSLLTINQVLVDGCYIKTGIKCDYLFEVINPRKDIEKVYYVELKGSDVEHAVNQLKTTLSYCHNQHVNFVRECHIVGSKFPKAGTASQVLKKKFLGETQVFLHINTKIHEVTV